MLVIQCSVAHKFLDDVELGNDAIRSAVVEFMPYSFAAVNAQSKRFLEVCACNSAVLYHTDAQKVHLQSLVRCMPGLPLKLYI